MKRDFRPGDAKAAGEFALGECLYQPDACAATHARRGRSVDRRGGIHVETRDRSRAVDVPHRAQCPQRDHSPLGVAHLEITHVAGLHAKWRVGLQVDLPGTPELVKVVCIIAAEIHLQRGENIAERHPERFRLGSVNVHEKLRRIGAKTAEKPG